MDFLILNHPWDEAYLIMVDDRFDVFLDSVGKNLSKYFCIDIHKGNWLEVLFLCWIFVWFWYQCNCGVVSCVVFLLFLFCFYSVSLLN